MIAQSLDDLPHIACFDHSARGRLLLAAAHLFHQQGYEKTTVRDLAQVLGIQSGSLFHHFKSKQEILATVMEQTIAYNHDRLIKAIDSSNDPELQLKALIRTELDSITGDTGAAMAVLVFEWSALSPEQQQPLLQLRENYEQLWLDVIQQLVDIGKIQHDAFIWRRLIGGAIAWTVNWYQADGKMSLEQLSEIVWQMALPSK